MKKPKSPSKTLRVLTKHTPFSMREDVEQCICGYRMADTDVHFVRDLKFEEDVNEITDETADEKQAVEETE